LKTNDKPCPYLHLSPARPAGVAAANAGNAHKVLEWMGHFSKQLPFGFVRFASDIIQIPDGNVSVIGGTEYIIPFGLDPKDYPPV